MIAAIDIGLKKTGIAKYENCSFKCLTVENKLKNRIDGIIYIVDTIGDILCTKDLEIVIIENYAYSVQHLVLAELTGAIIYKLKTFRKNIVIEFIPPNVWKKIIFCKGNIEKKEYYKIMKDRYGVANADEAAALAMLQAYLTYITV